MAQYSTRRFPSHSTQCTLASAPDFVLVEEHVGDSVGDWELPSGLRTDEMSFDQLHFEQNVMQLTEKGFVILVIGRGTRRETFACMDQDKFPS